MLMAPPPESPEEYIQRFAETWKVLRVGSSPKTRRSTGAAKRAFERGLNPAGVGRQLRAVLASGSRKQRLHAVKAPTLVIHGTVDPLVHPEGGQDTAASIPGAKLLMIEGMGHALPIPMWPQIIEPSTSTPMARQRRRHEIYAFIAIQITWRAPPPLPVARTAISLTSKPAPRRRFVKAGWGPEDQTARTPRGRSAACAAFNPAAL